MKTNLELVKKIIKHKNPGGIYSASGKSAFPVAVASEILKKLAATSCGLYDVKEPNASPYNGEDIVFIIAR